MNLGDILWDQTINPTRGWFKVCHSATEGIPGNQCISPSQSAGYGSLPPCYLQELRIPKEFKEALIKNHPLIRSSMVTHLFNTYIPKTKLELEKSSLTSLEIKCNKLDKLLAAQRRLIDANSAAVGNL